MTGNGTPFRVGDTIRHRATHFRYKVTEVTDTGGLRVLWLDDGFTGFIAKRRLNEYELESRPQGRTEKVMEEGR